MTDTKISALTALTGAGVASNDALPIVDTSATTTKKIDASELKTYMSASPALVTPDIGTPSAGTLTSCTGLPVSTGISGLGTGVATALAVNTGSAGSFVVYGGALDTPSSGTLTNCTGLPVSTGVSGLGTGVATALAVNAGSAGCFVRNNASETISGALTLTSAAPQLTLGVNATTLGQIKLFGSTSGDVTVKAAAAAGTATIFQLPATNGTNGYVLQTNGAGVTSWVTPGAATLSVGSGISGGTAARVLFESSANQLGESSGLTWDDSSKLLTVTGAGTGTSALTISGGSLTLSGNQSAASWGLTGIKVVGGGSTLTDTSGAGTVASGATDVFGGNTIAASNARTFTNYYSAYMKDPVAGSNVTFTKKWSLGLEGGVKTGGLCLLGGTSLYVSDEHSIVANTADNVVNVTNTNASRFSAVGFVGVTEGYPMAAIGYANSSTSAPWGPSATFFESFRNGALGAGNAPDMRFVLTNGSGVGTTIIQLDGDKSRVQNFVPLVVYGNSSTLGTVPANINPIIANGNTNGNLNVIVQNESSGASANADFIMRCKTAAGYNTCTFAAYSDSFSYRAYPTTGGAFFTDGAGGIAIMAINAGGIIKFVTGTDNTSGEAGRITSSGLWVFGPVAASALSGFPALKRSSTTLQARLGDDSADAPFSCAALSVNGDVTVSTKNIITDTSTGTKIATGTTQKIGFWNATPIAQPTTAVTAATVASTGTGDVVAATTTFDGYTIPQVVKALRNAGLLA